MTETALHNRIVDAEQRFREAYLVCERAERPTPAQEQAVIKAEDHLRDLKDEAFQCQVLGCRNVDEQHVYCADHRGWAQGFGKDTHR